MSNAIVSQSPVKRLITDDGRLLNAIDRAKNELHHNARKITDTHFVVYSASNNGTEYDVHVTSSGLRCNCKSGQYGKVCKHVAKVGLRLNREGDTRLY